MENKEQKVEELITKIRDFAKTDSCFVVAVSKDKGMMFIDGFNSAEVVGMLEIKKINFLGKVEKHVLDED